MRARWHRWMWPAAIAAVALMSVPAANIYYHASWGRGCARCHEISFDYDEWRHSSHRNLNCTDCHATSLYTNLRRVAAHLTDRVPDRVHLGSYDVDRMLPRCKSCHQQEFAAWGSGAHSTTYARIFTDRKHNAQHLLMEDCLRCHGMHFDGGIEALVEPVNTVGPWRLRESAYANRPAIPCLACHAIHREGMPLMKPKERIGGLQEVVRPSVGLYDRRTRLSIGASILPLPAIYEGSRPVKMSPDQRQALCYQCHAPAADMQVGSDDDRTPLGVHEGLSCFACHQNHGESTRQSCAGCHPRLSNCGIDVEKMDTTFRSPKSAHDVHTVKCLDCHPKGVPRKRPVLSPMR
jgi:hypothetical protein